LPDKLRHKDKGDYRRLQSLYIGFDFFRYIL
jgi:hypothetical protein